MKIIGHRGARGLAPENTITSFDAALEFKVDAIEVDVRTTRDHVAVLSHDEKLGKINLLDMDFDDLKSASPGIVTLEEALAYLENKTEIILDIKPGCELAPVLACLDQTIAKFSIASFDFELLKKFRKVLPDQTFVINERWSGVRASFRARKLGTTHISMNQRWLWGGFIKSVKRNNYHLYAYTLNNPKKAKRWAKKGLYAIYTDFPDKFSGL